jgi:hypothetical protein
LPHDHDGANAPYVIRAGVLRLGVLQQREQKPVGAERAIDALDRNGSVDRQRLKSERERDGSSQRKNRKLGRERCGGVGHQRKELIQEWTADVTTSVTAALTI